VATFTDSSLSKKKPRIYHINELSTLIKNFITNKKLTTQTLPTVTKATKIAKINIRQLQNACRYLESQFSNNCCQANCCQTCQSAACQSCQSYSQTCQTQCGPAVNCSNCYCGDDSGGM
jgi:hypothetical protein